jgi:hypothetical protein
MPLVFAGLLWAAMFENEAMSGITTPAMATIERDLLETKAKLWQERLGRADFFFPENQASVLYSFSQFRAKCRIHLICDPENWWRHTIKFERGGKEILTLPAHAASVFRTADNVLYFAEFPTSTSGCTVIAYDLATGNKLWSTDLRTPGQCISHSAYSNEVAMYLSSLPDLDKDGEGVVIIMGHESYGDYMQVLDRTTGAVLAQRTFREGYCYDQSK